MQEWIQESNNGEIYSTTQKYMEYIGIYEFSDGKLYLFILLLLLLILLLL